MATVPPPMRLIPIGEEGEQIAVLEALHDDLEAIRELADRSSWRRDARFFPGMRAQIGDAYLTAVVPRLEAVIGAFGYRRLRVEGAFLALVTDPPGQLSAPQTIPHFDASDLDRFAVVHYLHEASFGGTAFFRHRSTGFERITGDREQPYFAALRADMERHGRPTRGYFGADSAIWERTGVFDAVPNRALLYRGALLHSAVIDQPERLTANPRVGRLTATLFMRANH